MAHLELLLAVGVEIFNSPNKEALGELGAYSRGRVQGGQWKFPRMDDHFRILVQVGGEKVQDSEFVDYPGHCMGVAVIRPWNDPEGGQFRIRFSEKGA